MINLKAAKKASYSDIDMSSSPVRMGIGKSASDLSQSNEDMDSVETIFR
jgi:hypothetical protein